MPVFLINIQLLHKVDIGAMRDKQLRLAHPIGAVGHDVDAATEAEVLGIVGGKGNLYTLVVANIHRVLNKEAIETNGILSRDGRNKLMTQQAYIIIKDVHVGKAVGQYAIENLASSEELVETILTLTCDDSLLCSRILAPYLSRGSLLECDGQNALARLGSYLHVVFHEGNLLQHTLTECLLINIIEGKGQLLI